ncbi:pro-neuregulin-3, membrane-bound isoform [Scleropages formosus]|uniref:pro-neuregulin-3, membrane-bound isoform n=1 Tax=Scleropages formosus TaxID=113540 RepID=UPI0010FAA0E0|nr:pro-neuregulin-3, membrane-bound isoform [Scleropages formosus]
MSDSSGPPMPGALILEERDVGGAGGGAGREQASPPEAGSPRCGGCAMWTRQQTWLCVVPLLIGLVGLGLSLMLLQWILVGSVPDYVPTDLVDAKGIGQDPIFLSKPSAFPKGPASTAATVLATAPDAGSTAAVTTAAGRTRAGTRSGPTTSSQVPHLHNRISTRITAGSTTTRAPRVVTPRSTVRRLGGAARGGLPPSTNRAAPSSAPSPSGHPVLHDSTQTQSHEHVPKGPPGTPGRLHPHAKTLTPTSPPLRSEHFKPCRDKDLAYCLNEGECFIVETLTGSHKHCRCKEGYQGVRCDQFLPKTDSILSDPKDNLGIEFMESKETYKRQVLSISCIAVGISLLGTFCMALYCRNKRRGEKFQVHLKECRSLKSYSASGLVTKSSLRSPCGLQVQSCGKGNGSSPPQGGSVRKPGMSPSGSFPPLHPKTPSPGKYHSPTQRTRSTLGRTSPRRTPPGRKGRLNPIVGCRDSGPTYKHLQEVQSEREAEPLGGCSSLMEARDHMEDISLNMQVPASATVVGSDPEGAASLPLFRNYSIPIIPSVQGHSETCEPAAGLDGGNCCSVPYRSQGARA